MHRSLGFFVLAIGLASCSDDAAGPRLTKPASPVHVSNSRAMSALSSTSPTASMNEAAATPSDRRVTASASRTVAIPTDETNVAYISLLPTTYPNGVSAVITNLRSGAKVTAPMVDGGFDPIPLPASAGDSVRIEVQSALGATITVPTSVVPPRQPPTVVRSSPGRGKTGVPLNKTIAVVFSEPISLSSLSASAVRLIRGGEPIAGTVQILEGVTATVVFRPGAPLDPNTDYQLVVTKGVHDLDGDALDSAVTVPFTTGTTVEGPVASLSLIPDAADVSVQDQFQLVVTARDAQGTILTGHAVTWSMTDPTVAKVSRTGLVTALGEGSAAILAEVDGMFIAMLVRVSNALHPVASVTVSMDSASVEPNGIQKLAAIAKDADGNLLERRLIHWTSSNTAVATVAQSPNDGAMYRAEVSGVANGVTKIVATIEGLSDTVVVTVAHLPSLVGFVLATDTTTLLLRETTELSGLSVNSAGGRTSVPATEIQWESSNAGVASVNSTGIITGVAAGSATVTGHWNNYSSSVRVTVVQVSFETMSAGRTHTCALTPAGATYCWGANDFGQAGRPGVIGGSLGGPATVFYSTPIRVADDLTFVGVTAGGFHSCALTAGGVAYCWGYNGLGSLGSDNFVDSWRPVRVTGGLNFVAIDAGTYHTCGLTSGGIAYCWGSNRSGQLGTSGPISSSKPLAVAGGLSFASVSAGGSHTCGVTTDGVAYCWGENAGGQLGVGENVTSSSTPLPVSGGLTFSSVSAGDAHTCGVTRSGSLYCWGWNFDNQLGNGTSYMPSAVPVPVASSLSFIAVGGGTSHTCALDASGAAYCWGQNRGGQVGLGTATQELFATPQRVVGGLAFGKLSVGRSHTCAATTDGVWYCWGDNESGVLGVGTTTVSGIPAKVLGQQ